jgi:hypothetical protein
MAGGQVGIEGVDVLLAEARRPPFDLLRIYRQQGAFGMTQDAAAIRRVVEPRMSFSPAGTLVFGCDGVDLPRDVKLGRDALRCGLHEA